MRIRNLSGYDYVEGILLNVRDQGLLFGFVSGFPNFLTFPTKSLSQSLYSAE